jgi:hypothetical protein
MMPRRTIVLGGLLTIATVNARCACAQTSGEARSTGCLVTPQEAKQLLARTAGVQLFVTGKEAIKLSSGDREFDYALAQTLATIAETLNVLPGFGFYDDVEQAQAFATAERKLSRADGTVLFGMRLLKRLLSLTDHPTVAVATVCAHEFGHIVQFKHGLMAELRGSDPTVRRMELHADFLAGYYAGIRKLRRPNYPAVVFALTAHGGGNIARDDPSHHGFPSERGAAVVHGFKAAHQERRSLPDAIQYGMRYARSV